MLNRKEEGSNWGGGIGVLSSGVSWQKDNGSEICGSAVNQYKFGKVISKYLRTFCCDFLKHFLHFLKSDVFLSAALFAFSFIYVFPSEMQMEIYQSISDLPATFERSRTNFIISVGCL